MGTPKGVWNKIQCSDEDYDQVLTMISVLLRHSTHVYSRLPLETRPPVRKNIREKFLDALPAFSTGNSTC